MTVPKIKKKRTFVSRGARDGAVVRALALPTIVVRVQIPASTPYVG